MVEESKNNEIIIADRDIRIYLGQCAIDFQRFDQLVLSAGDTYVEKMRYIANILAALGVVVERRYLGENGKIRFITEEAEVLNERTGRREKRMFHKLGVSKIPELFMYTDPETAIDVPHTLTEDKEEKKKRR